MTESAGDDPKLNRTLGLPLVTLYGLGNILGAGIYVLVGKVAGFAGSSTTLVPHRNGDRSRHRAVPHGTRGPLPG